MSGLLEQLEELAVEDRVARLEKRVSVLEARLLTFAKTVAGELAAPLQDPPEPRETE